MRILKTIVISFLIWSLVLISTGCPKMSIETLKSNSKDVATYANAGVEITRTLYRAGKISLGKKDVVADGFTTLAQGGQAVDGLIASVEREYGDKAPPKDVVKRIFDTFNTDVVAKFVVILRELKIPLPGIDSDTWGATLDLLKTAILAFAGVFGKRAVVAAQIAGA